ncbi:hypothetical protein BH23PLA1_BH23PLA1_25910 [soil metagenome]
MTLKIDVDADPSATATQGHWEEAYRAFEMPEQEIRKFLKRMRRLGVDRWSRDRHLIELFCGRGNGLVALGRLGFQNLEGLDLSANLVRSYRGPARIWVGDARVLPLASRSYDGVIVQGGLHHLVVGPDLERALAEIRRILKPDGHFVMVEPWQTPFLGVVHAACRRRWVRRASRKIAALARMIELERDTYESWLQASDFVLTTLQRHFRPTTVKIGRGKLMLVAQPADPQQS